MYKYDKIEIENLCEEGNVNNAQEIVKYTPSQDFVSHYFTPKLDQKGLLAWHSVGTGKTCMAIATKSKTWEQMGYTILWVTRTTLKNDIWKNMYVKICDYIVKKKLASGVKIPANIKSTADVRSLLTKNFLQPVSFKQFSNATKGTGPLYERLASINGKEDILKKTLVIIDEAHKFFAGDLIAQEKPDFPSVENAVYSSFMKSKGESCRLLLMTATPILDDPMNYLKLLNLMIENPEDRFPTEMDEFLKKYPVDKEMNFTKESTDALQEILKGKISYLDQRWDPRKFTQPVFHNVNVPMKILKIDSEDCDDTLNAEDAISDAKHAEELKECEKLDVETDTIDDEAITEIQEKIASEEKNLVQNQINLEKALLTAEKGYKLKTTQIYGERSKTFRNKIKEYKETLKNILKKAKTENSSKSASVRKCITSAKNTLKKAKQINKSKFSKCKKNTLKNNKEYETIDQRTILNKKCFIKDKEL